jgi:hypothetical protein
MGPLWNYSKERRGEGLDILPIYPPIKPEQGCSAIADKRISGVGIDLHQLAQRLTGPLTCTLIGVPSP